MFEAHRVADGLSSAANLVRERPELYEPCLRQAVDAMPGGWRPEVRATAIARAIDRLAFAALEGAILRGGGRAVVNALQVGCFDDYLHPASVRALIGMARAGPHRPVVAADQSNEAASPRRLFLLEDVHV